MTTRVRLCEDGKYRWTYSLNMLTNPAILLVVLKIIGILFSLPLVYVLIRTAIGGNWAEAWGDSFFDSSIRILLALLILFLIISVIAYLIVAWTYHGKYVVHFTLDEKTLVHEVDPVQSSRARALGVATAVAGAAAKRPSTAGAGMIAATRTTSTSELANVRRLKVRRALHLIKVNQFLNHNQVYVPKEDFDLILTFLRQHCPKVK